MSGTDCRWKMRQSVVRVRNQSQGTISARYVACRPAVPDWVKQLMMPWRWRTPRPAAIETVTPWPTMASKSACSSRPSSSASKWKRVETPSVPLSAVMSSASGPRGVSIRSRRFAWVKSPAIVSPWVSGSGRSDLLVLLEVPADRRALACGLPVEADLGVRHLDLGVLQRPALAGHAALAGAADLDRRDHDVAELVLHVGLLVPAGAAEREDGGGEVVAGGARLRGLGRRLVEVLLDDQRAHVAALASEGAGGGHGAGDGLGDAPAERDHLDLVLVLGVVGLTLDPVDLQEHIGWHGTDPFCWEPCGSGFECPNEQCSCH